VAVLLPPPPLLLLLEGAARTMPANSKPAIQGKAGGCGCEWGGDFGKKGSGKKRGERVRTGLVLVFPLHLEDVEEVGSRGVDLDQVLVGLWDRIREG